MQRVGSISDEGSGRAAVDFPETTGRYILLKWTPAEPGAAFSVAEIAAFGGGKRENLVAANTVTDAATGDGRGDGKMVLDGKDFKDMADGKECRRKKRRLKAPIPHYLRRRPLSLHR